MRNKYANNEKHGGKIVVSEYVRLDMIMVVIYCYLEKENY